LDDADQSSLVIPPLMDEFGERVDPSVIREVAIHELSLFDGAKVRDFVPIIAWRLARARLLEEVAPTRSRAPDPSSEQVIRNSATRATSDD
jgi:hypothetical protein